MKNIRDLQFKKEIVPLFDTVCNEHSRDTLYEILETAPSSLEEVLLRQHILKGMIGNKHLLKPFAYARLEFDEVYNYIREVGQKEPGWKDRSRLYFYLHRRNRHRERGKQKLLYLFFCRLYKAWFASLDMKLFPVEYAEQLDVLQQFLGELKVNQDLVVARDKNFSIEEIAARIALIQTWTRNERIRSLWESLFHFEAWLSIARGIQKHAFVFPDFTGEKLSLEGFYHPLLKAPVSNSLAVTRPVILITGPNMSGKSTLLKSIGLCVYLAHMGLAVPAQRCQMPFFEMIFISINLEDDMASGYSHFMTEIQNLKSVVIEAGKGKRCFAIFDELFRGTNAEDALAISVTTIEGLSQFVQSYFFISTHLHQLQGSLSHGEEQIVTHYIECRLSDDRPQFTYRLKEGWSQLRIGQILFEQEGLAQLLKPASRPS